MNYYILLIIIIIITFFYDSNNYYECKKINNDYQDYQYDDIIVKNINKDSNKLNSRYLKDFNIIKDDNNKIVATLNGVGKKNFEDDLLLKINKDGAHEKIKNLEKKFNDEFIMLEKKIKSSYNPFFSHLNKFDARNLADFSTLNDYWTKVTYGKNPGPCPNYTNRCQSLVCNLQDYLLNIQFNVPLLGTRTLKQLVIEQAGDNNPSNCAVNAPSSGSLCTGLIELYELTCNGLSVNDIRIILQKEQSNLVEADFRINNLRLQCSGKVKYQRLGLDYLGHSGNGYRSDSGKDLIVLRARNPLEGDANFNINAKNDNTGLTLYLKTRWYPATKNGGSFNTDVPYSFEFVNTGFTNSDDGGCYLKDFFSSNTLSFTSGSNIKIQTKGKKIYK